ncbi:MAG: orotidine-5'-phosphate decarboxylase [Candidatus Omnitrophota bacterium]|nr:orotidine-5'-phosphate decarboxylase [Candidatus Omnitrophota bacterium]
MAKGDKIIVALDVNDLEEMENLIDKLRAVVKIFKIGSELFTSCGVRAVDIVRRKGGRVFLDLKYHDIPNTVAKASKAAAKQGIHMFTVHAMGGLEMMKASVKAAREEAERLGSVPPIILGITVLTSLNSKDIQAVGMDRTVNEQVIKLVKLAEKAGLDGVVASPKEAPEIRKHVRKDFLIVTPGIRPSWSMKRDQKRVAEPKEAIELGADYLVIGRPITAQEDPKAAAERIANEIYVGTGRDLSDYI